MGSVLLIALWGTTAQALPVAGQADGTVFDVADRSGVLGGAVSPGATVRVRFAYDLASVDSEPDPNMGHYDLDPSVPFSVEIGSLTLLSTGGPAWLETWNDSAMGDRWSLHAEMLVDPAAPDWVIDSVDLELIDETSLSILSDVLPSCPPDVTSYGLIREIWMYGHSVSTGGSFSIYADLTSVGGNGLPQVSSTTVGVGPASSSVLVGCVSPGASVRVYGGAPGLTPLAGCYAEGTQLPIASAKVLGSAVADASGHATLGGVVPASASGQTWTLAAVEAGTCDVSQPAMVFVP